MAALSQRRHTVAAWLVHAYTASGVVLAFLMFIAVMEGDTVRALWLFLIAMVVDGTDGFLARHFRVKEVVPQIDGALLDNIVDYLTYVFAPVVLLLTNDKLPGGAWGLVVAALAIGCENSTRGAPAARKRSPPARVL